VVSTADPSDVEHKHRQREQPTTFDRMLERGNLPRLKMW
jgi:hypothetical protein